jgi:hypothetical protein
MSGQDVEVGTFGPVDPETPRPSHGTFGGMGVVLDQELCVVEGWVGVEHVVQRHRWPAPRSGSLAENASQDPLGSVTETGVAHKRTPADTPTATPTATPKVCGTRRTKSPLRPNKILIHRLVSPPSYGPG